MRAVRPEPVAGLQRARPRESAPAYSWQTGRARAPRGASDGGDPQRARPASGAPIVSRGQQEARGARQRVALCFGSRGGRARPVPIEELEPGARVPRHFLELCEWFRDCSQASGASQRVQRASAPRPSIGLRCGWPCTAWPTARPQPGSCFAEFDRCAPASCSGSLPCQRGAHSVRRRMSLSVLRAARGQRVLCGTEWTLCAPTGGAALPGSAASLVPAARAAALARERARVRPQPIQYTAHARAAASAVRCEPRVRRCAHSVGRVAARVFRAGSSLGRWRCGSCAFRPWNRGVARGSAGYLVDPASSHMLVSKIKPCMSKYKRLVL